MRIDRCKRGHLYTSQNTKWYKHTTNGKLYRHCRSCRARQVKLRYRNDDAYREKEKARNLAKYYATSSTSQELKCSPKS